MGEADLEEESMEEADPGEESKDPKELSLGSASTDSIEEDHLPMVRAAVQSPPPPPSPCQAPCHCRSYPVQRPQNLQICTASTSPPPSN
jgi:hypothetical protein